MILFYVIIVRIMLPKDVKGIIANYLTNIIGRHTWEGC